MCKFISGLKLSESFYNEAVKPILETHFSGLQYSAALIGYGSDVLGFDTPVSTDHEWGPRLLLFLSEKDYEKYEAEIEDILSKKLPYIFQGFSTNFSFGSVQWQEYIQSGYINHKVWIQTITSFFNLSLDFNPYSNIEILDWLVFSEQRLLEITSGQVYYDGLRELNYIRSKFNYYPKDIWLYLLAVQWTSIAQEEAFIGRCGDVGIVYEIIAQMHNALSLTKPLETSVSNYYNRPYLVIHANRFSEAIRDVISNKEVQNLPANIGAIDQFVASMDVLEQPRLGKKLKKIFE